MLHGQKEEEELTYRKRFGDDAVALKSLYAGCTCSVSLLFYFVQFYNLRPVLILSSCLLHYAYSTHFIYTIANNHGLIRYSGHWGRSRRL